MVYIEDGVPYFKSNALRKAVHLLRFPWPGLAIGFIVPRSIRDWVYGLVARTPYRVFGKREECVVPTGDLTERLL